jgi:hypothetical protein
MRFKLLLPLQVWVVLRDIHGRDLSEWIKLAQLYITLPTTSVANERSFSQMNLIKTALRNRTGTVHLNALMRLASSRFTHQDYPFVRAFELWDAEVKRRFAAGK